APGQPDRVAALARGQVERPSGREVGALRLHEPVRSGRPDQLGGGVPLVPGIGVHGPNLTGVSRPSRGRGGAPGPGRPVPGRPRAAPPAARRPPPRRTPRPTSSTTTAGGRRS